MVMNLHDILWMLSIEYWQCCEYTTIGSVASEVPDDTDDKRKIAIVMLHLR